MENEGIFDILDRNAQPLCKSAIKSIRQQFPEKTASFSDDQCLKVWLNIFWNNCHWAPESLRKSDIFDLS